MVSQHALQVVSQNALQVSGGGAAIPPCFTGSIPACLAWGVSRPHTQGGSWGVWLRGEGLCIIACTEADPPPVDSYCRGRYASYWNAFLLSKNIGLNFVGVCKGLDTWVPQRPAQLDLLLFREGVFLTVHRVSLNGLFRQSLNGTGTGTNTCRNTSHCNLNGAGITHGDYCVSSPKNSPGKVQNGLISHLLNFPSCLRSHINCRVKVHHNVH